MPYRRQRLNTPNIPSSPPNYIYPFMDSAESSNVNLFDFTYLMYRPLYWFGEVGQPVVNTSLSLAAVPVISGRTVTITLKHYMWSNGAPVTAQDSMFWINLDRAVPQDWFDYSPGTFPRERVEHPHGRHEPARDDDQQVVLVDLVRVQRAGPDHAHAGGVGPDRVRTQQLRHDGQRLRGGRKLSPRPGQGPVHAVIRAAAEGTWPAGTRG